MKIQKSKKKKSLFFKVLKRIKVHHIIFLIVLLVANSYAWFVYVNNVRNSVDVYVRAWRIDFDDGQQNVSEEVNVVVDSIFPGMTNFEKSINAHNYSDVEANVTYSILSASIVGTDYVTQEGRQENGETVQSGDLTSAQLQTKLENDYPFKIMFSLSNTVMAAQVGTSTYTIQIQWPYESGNDQADTLWGTRAYDFKQSHPDDACISLRIKIYITQASGS